MQNRITAKFEELKSRNKKALIAFITAGYPDLDATVALVPALAKAGADIIELGIPFSDPVADGPVIQESSCRALKRHLTMDGLFKTAQKIRAKTSVPMVFMTYYNPVFHYGEGRFLKRARQSGIDGLIVPDLPPEEAGTFTRLSRKHEIANIFFLSPTTTPARAKKIIALSTGFIYYISLTGVTGARAVLPKDLVANIRKIKTLTAKPVCVGFGISKSAQIRALAKTADGVIVGSAIVGQISKYMLNTDMVRKVSGFVRTLADALN